MAMIKGQLATDRPQSDCNCQSDDPQNAGSKDLSP